MPIAHESGYKLAQIVKKGTNRRIVITVAGAAVVMAAFAVPVSISGDSTVSYRAASISGDGNASLPLPAPAYGDAQYPTASRYLAGPG
jgi:hypothetical protein